MILNNKSHFLLITVSFNMITCHVCIKLISSFPAGRGNDSPRKFLPVSLLKKNPDLIIKDLVNFES